jgi:alkyl hydroperoxide reductase subunit F
MHDLIIIGGGPAGMTAAVYGARKKLSVLIITRDFGGQALQSPAVENYLGYQYITGLELVGKFEAHMDQFEIDKEMGLVEGLSRKDDIFTVTTQSGKQFESKTVIIASGKASRRLEIPGEKKLIGRGVSYCATCDAPVFAGMGVAVIGGGNSALSAAAQLSSIANGVYLIARSKITADEVVLEKVQAAENVTFYKGYIPVLIKGEALVSGLVIEERSTKQRVELNVQGVFVEVGSIPVSQFASDLVKLNEKGEIEVDCAARTSTAGIFAAGDVTNVPEKQIIIAAGDGAKAALGAYDYLLKH